MTLINDGEVEILDADYTQDDFRAEYQPDYQSSLGSPLIKRANSTENAMSLTWSGITYDVKDKAAPMAPHCPALARPANGKWSTCIPEKLNPDGSAEVKWNGAFNTVHIAAEDLKPAGKKRILKGVNGSINGGRVCCIMGPSGAGKSSLLNLLAGRVATGVNGVTVQGSVMLDNSPLNPKDFRNKVAYVTQEDSLFPTQTPYEALHFSAKLRNPSLSAEGREELVMSTLKKLRLEKCANTYTGNSLIPGLSGGEKKRTAIGIELVANPQYLFLDEPTSGLDSYSSWLVCDMLRQLANGEYDGVKRTVVATIHQPSSEVFQLFEDVILVSAGRSVYDGPVANLETHFANAGHPVSAGHNPADHIMFCMQLEGMWLEQQSLENEELVPLDSNTETLAPAEAKRPKQLLADYWENVSGSAALIPMQREVGSGEQELTKSAKASMLVQLHTLSLRESQNVIRDRMALLARFGTTIFINLIVALVFKGVGATDQGWQVADDGLNRHFGGVSQIALGGMFGCAQPMLLSFPLEKPVFLREFATGTYSTFPYFISKLLVEIPLTLLQCLVQFLVCYFLMELQGNFVWMTLATTALGLVSSSISVVLGSVSTNPQDAMALSPVVLIPQVLFAGIFIKTSFMPAYLRWAQYLCPLKYGINLLAIAEFKTSPFETGSPAYINSTEGVDQLLDNLDIDDSAAATYCGLMIGLFIGFRALAFIVLVRKGSRLQA